jgi:hypothetical protein
MPKWFLGHKSFEHKDLQHAVLPCCKNIRCQFGREEPWNVSGAETAGISGTSHSQ